MSHDDAARAALVAAVTAARSASDPAKALDTLRPQGDQLAHNCDHPAKTVIETDFLPLLDPDEGASYRLCLFCGRFERQRNGAWGRITNIGTWVSTTDFKAALTRIHDELGVPDMHKRTIY